MLASAILAAVLVGCGNPNAVSDTQRVWCSAHPVAVVTAGDALGVVPSRFVQHKAELEQATLDGDSARAESLILQWVASEMTATDSDPHANTKSMPSWEADAPADWQRACQAAYEAR